MGGQCREFYDDWKREEKELRNDAPKYCSKEDLENIIALEKIEWDEWKKQKELKNVSNK